MDDIKVKEAFLKVKQDMQDLINEINFLKSQINEIKSLLGVKYLINSIPTDKLINPTHPNNPTQNPTVPQEIKGLKSPILSTSTRNKGVPTDRQTDNPTNQQTQDLSIDSDIKEVSNMLDSLDLLKKEIRKKFKSITNQEMIVFSTIYQLEEQEPSLPTYKQLSLKLNLTESSIRDYVKRLLSKGIPIIKQKVDNKKIYLSISPNLKKIASLNTIFQLREL